MIGPQACKIPAKASFQQQQLLVLQACSRVIHTNDSLVIHTNDSHCVIAPDCSEPKSEAMPWNRPHDMMQHSRAQVKDQPLYQPL